MGTGAVNPHFQRLSRGVSRSRNLHFLQEIKQQSKDMYYFHNQTLLESISKYLQHRTFQVLISQRISSSHITTHIQVQISQPISSLQHKSSKAKLVKALDQRLGGGEFNSTSGKLDSDQRLPRVRCHSSMGRLFPYSQESFTQECVFGGPEQYDPEKGRITLLETAGAQPPVFEIF